MDMYNTGNPVGSTAPKDLSDNAQVFDRISVGTDPWVTSRLGQKLLSLRGMNYEFNNAQTGRDAAFQAFLEASGYAYAGDYGAGITLTTRTQYLVRDGVMFRLSLDTTVPYTTTGNWAEEQVKFVAFDANSALGQDLAEADDPGKGSALVGHRGRTLYAKLGEVASVKDTPYSAKGDGSTDDTAAIFACRQAEKEVVFPSGDYALNAFPGAGTVSRVLRGQGVVNLNWSFVSATAWANFLTDTSTENIRFVCTQPRTGVRASVENAKRVTLRNVHLEGFNAGTIQDPLTDGWGLYFKNASDVLVDSPTFANNGQSDICFVDDVSNVTVLNATNSVQTGVSFNLEPNSRGALSNGARGLNMVGGTFNAVSLHEPENFTYASSDVVFTGAAVSVVNYGGAGTRFVGCKIGSLRGLPNVNKQVFGGPLSIDNADLIPLLADPYLADAMATGSLRWGVVTTGGANAERRLANGSRFMRFNPSKVSGTAYAASRDSLPVTGGQPVVAVCRSRSDNTGSAAVHVFNMAVQFFDSGNALLETHNVRCARTAAGTNSGWRTDVAVITVPTLATSAKVLAGQLVSGAFSVDIAAAGLFGVVLNVGTNGSWDAEVEKLSRATDTREFPTAVIPASNTNFFVGDRAVRTPPVVGQPKAWVNTVAGAVGSAGTWVSEGNL